MREIKFRGWYEAGQCYVKEWGLLGGLSANHALPGPPDGYFLEQFIGLKDKNGVEIYEGDICKVENAPYPWVVQWDDERCTFDPPRVYPPGENMEYEVVGNIHEHKELLK